MRLEQFRNINDIEIFKKLLIDLDNWRSNISEDEEDLDTEILNYIQNKYSDYLREILKNKASVTQLEEITHFIYYLNY
jgi:hypothetical protein